MAAEAIVCGAGTAGLAAAGSLRRAGIEATVLERSDQVGASWRSRYSALRLNTPGWMSTQPGLRAKIRRYGEFPSQDKWIEYLEEYAAHHTLDIRFGTEVRRVDRGDGIWRVETGAGALEAGYGLPRPDVGMATLMAKRHQSPLFDDGFVESVKAGRIEIVSAVKGFDGPDVLLADGSRIQPDAVIAATGYRRGLAPLVGHLGVLDKKENPLVHGGRQHPSAPGLFFTGYRTALSGQLRLMRFDARSIARALS